MKTNRIIRLVPLLMTAVLFTGCKVDRDYDLSKIDDDGGIRIGEFLSVPLGKINYTLDDLFDNNIEQYYEDRGYDPSKIGQEPLPLDVSNVTEYPVGVDFGENLASMFDAVDNIDLVVSGTNGIPAGYSLQIEFVGDETHMIGPVEIGAPEDGKPSAFSVNESLDYDTFEKMMNCDQIRIVMEADEVNVTFNKTDKIQVKLHLEVTGGIKLGSDE